MNSKSRSYADISFIYDDFQCQEEAVWLTEDEMEQQLTNPSPGLLGPEPIALIKQLLNGKGTSYKPFPDTPSLNNLGQNP